MDMEKACTIRGCRRKRYGTEYCMTHHKNPPDRLFWQKVDKGGEAGCWEWTGCKSKSGYGQLRVAGRSYPAHRWSYMMANGDVSESLVIDHMCFNHSCVNPSHLRPLTQTQNKQNIERARSHSRSGIRGVSWEKGLNRWRVTAKLNKRKYYIGVFADVEEAEAAAIKWRQDNIPHGMMDNPKR